MPYQLDQGTKIQLKTKITPNQDRVTQEAEQETLSFKIVTTEGYVPRAEAQTFSIVIKSETTKEEKIVDVTIEANGETSNEGTFTTEFTDEFDIFVSESTPLTRYMKLQVNTDDGWTANFEHPFDLTGTKKLTHSAVALSAIELSAGEPLFDTNTNRLHIGGSVSYSDESVIDVTGSTVSDKQTFLPAQGKDDEYHVTINDGYNIESTKVRVDSSAEFNVSSPITNIELTNTIKNKYATRAIGGIPANARLDKDLFGVDSDDKITIEKLLHKILGIQDGFAPTGFSFSISPSTIVADLVGDDNTTQTQALNATWSVSNKGTYTDAFDVDINNVDVSTSESQSVSIGSVSYKNANTSITVSGTCGYTGKDGYSSDTLRNSATLTIKRKCYYGDNSDPTYIEVTSKSQLCPNNISLNKSKAVFKYPKCWGAISLIKDSNGYDVTGLFDRTETTLHGGTYYVYTMKDDNTGTFKYSIS